MRSDNVMVAFANFRTKTEAAIAAGQEIEMEKTVNAPYEALKVFGKSEQKAKWYQAEGKTTQIQETGYNLLDCEAEWLPAGSDDEKGITNIVTGKGSVSFDFADNDNYNSFLENQKAIHLKAGSYYVSGNLESGTLDSVGFSGISEPIWGNCNGVITVPEEGDYKFYIYPFCLSQTLTISNLMIVEGDTSKTYQEYGYSKPSPAYPSELTSHISAGSYQIPTKNGIYEVTLTENLRGLDDTYRDFIRFDSVSGTGYLQKMCKEIVLDETRDYGIFTAYNRGDYIAFYSLINPDDMIKDTHAICLASDRYQAKGAYWGNGFSGNVIYQYGETSFNSIVLKTDKKLLSSTDAAGLKAWLTENPVTVIYKRKTPVKEALTFTKVESSTLPVLPWTAYGKNLVTCIAKDWTGLGDYKTLNITDGVMSAQAGSGATTRFVFRQKFAPGTYTASAVFESTARYIIRLYDSSSNLLTGSGISGFGTYNAYYKGFYFDESTVSFTIPSVASYWDFAVGFIIPNGGAVGDEVTVSNVQLESGQETSPYEPFNPTPPESITPSPDYPHHIYDLSNVMITSRGRNLFDAEDFYQFYRTNGNTDYMTTATKDGHECLKFTGHAGYVNGKYLVYPFDGKKNTRYTLRFVGSQDVVGAGYASGIGFYYSDGTTSTLPVENSTEWTEKTVQTPEGKTLVGLSLLYNYGNWVYMSKASIVMYEGVYTEENHPPYDKYRCTSATIPVAMRAIETVETNANFSKVVDGVTKHYCCDYIEISDGKVYHNQCVSRVHLPDTAVWSDWGVQKRIILGQATGIKKIGENTLGFFTLGESQKTLNNWANASGYIHPYSGNANLYWYLDYTLLGLDGTETKEVADARLQEWLPTIPDKYIDVIRTSPFRTEITDTWAQDLLGLKTAPYWTKIYTDKETGSLEATYKHF